MQEHVTTHQAEEDARNDAIFIYLNGEIVPKAQALVSVYDSGFMLGDDCACTMGAGPSLTIISTGCSRPPKPLILISV